MLEARAFRRDEVIYRAGGRQRPAPLRATLCRCFDGLRRLGICNYCNAVMVIVQNREDSEHLALKVLAGGGFD